MHFKIHRMEWRKAPGTLLEPSPEMLHRQAPDGTEAGIVWKNKGKSDSKTKSDLDSGFEEVLEITNLVCLYSPLMYVEKW